MNFMIKFWNRFCLNWAPVVAFTWTLIAYWAILEPKMTQDDNLVKLFVGGMFSLGLVFSGIFAVMGLAMLLVLAYDKMKLKKPFALPLRAFESKTVLYTWEDWRRDNRKEFPIRYFFTETLPRLMSRKCYQFKNMIRWVKYRTFSRHHMLDISGPGYHRGYIDQCDVILYASFKALVRYVEEELGGVFMENVPADIHDVGFWEYRVELEQEIKALYMWWTSRKCDDPYYDDSDEQHMLVRLVEIRQNLWS